MLVLTFEASTWSTETFEVMSSYAPSQTGFGPGQAEGPPETEVSVPPSTKVYKVLTKDDRKALLYTICSNKGASYLLRFLKDGD